MKKILIFGFLSLFAFTAFLVWTGYLMEIEDRYGDLQEIYWQASEGDSIVDNRGSKIGKIHFEDRRIYVLADGKSLHVDEWLTMEKHSKFDVTIWNPENPEGKKSGERVRN